MPVPCHAMPGVPGRISYSTVLQIQTQKQDKFDSNAAETMEHIRNVTFVEIIVFELNF
jgi:hypothetical protein